MAYVTREQLEQAREVDLLSYLRQAAPHELVPYGRNSYYTKSHDSLKISNGKWYWWSRGIGGVSALDYLIEVKRMSLPEAVEELLGKNIMEIQHVKPNSQTKRFWLPTKYVNNNQVIAYLSKRGIDMEIIRHCIRNNQLYEETRYHNCVFVGYHHGIAKYASMRSTLPGTKLNIDVSGSEKRYSFRVPLEPKNSQEVYVFESAIDALSYLTMFKRNDEDWRSVNVLSLSGVSGGKKIPCALEQYLEENNVKRIILCLDNDDAGKCAAEQLQRNLRQYQVINNPPPVNVKDYNDWLCGDADKEGDKSIQIAKNLDNFVVI